MTSQRTSHFLLSGRRELAVVTVADYVDWAVGELMDGQDSPSLRILAGLGPTEGLWLTEDYFAKAARELGLPEPKKDEAVFRYVDFLAEKLAREEGDTREYVRQIYQAYTMLGYPKMLGRWVYLDDAIDSVVAGYEPYYRKKITRENFASLAAEEAREYLDERTKCLVSGLKCDSNIECVTRFIV